jgi:hypothetical protein
MTPSLTNLDDGNLKATVALDECCATPAEGWFGVPASTGLPGNPPPIGGLIATI